MNFGFAVTAREGLGFEIVVFLAVCFAVWLILMAILPEDKKK